MAKKTTKQPETAPAAGTTSTGPTIERGANDRFVRVEKDGKPVDMGKLAPQAQCIVNTIAAAGAKGLSRTELVTNLKGVLKTKQPEGRIVSYYQKAILASGAVTLQKEAAPVAAAA